MSTDIGDALGGLSINGWPAEPLVVSSGDSISSFISECAIRLFANSAFVDPVTGIEKDENIEAINAVRRAKLLAGILKEQKIL